MTEPQGFPYTAAGTTWRGGLPFLPITLLHGDQRLEALVASRNYTLYTFDADGQAVRR